MRSERGSRRIAAPRGDPDIDGALDAMTAVELRAFVREVLEALDHEPWSALLDSLIARAAKGGTGWKPSGPSRRIIAEVERFARAAGRVGFADAAEVDAYLRQGTKAFLAGEHTMAREVFGALLPPIADVAIDLGQHEMVDEVLSVNVHECAAQYVASVYMTTPLEDRAKALCAALDAVRGLSSFWAPLEDIERAATAPLSQLDAFLPRWAEHLEQEPPSEGESQGDRDRWLREAVLRLEGVAGLERIARQTTKPEALRAWCAALVARRDWAEALRAYDEAIRLAGKSEWRGLFLDGAALAARELGRGDAAVRLEAAWVGAPSLVRLLRWLAADSPTGPTLARRARDAMMRCPATAGRQLGLLHVVTGNIHAAAKLLANAAGLGWSSEDHPGHLLFSAFAGLLAERTRTKLSAELLASLEEMPDDPWDADWGDGDKDVPKLSVPSVAEIIARARPALSMDAEGREAMLEAMRTAATKRIEGILGNKRRAHYGHAALLLASCMELAPRVGKQIAVAEWVQSVRKKYSRFAAFQDECERALACLSS